MLIVSNFEKIYNNAIERIGKYGGASPQLKPLLKRFYEELIHRPANLLAIKESMIDLLTFLTTPDGRTDANCRAVDIFVCIDDDWERDWSDLPESFRDIIQDIGGALHDTITYPDIATMCESTPEQLLSRVKKLKV